MEHSANLTFSRMDFQLLQRACTLSDKQKDVVIRNLNYDDFENWYGLWQAYQKFAGKIVSREEAQVVWAGLMNAHEPIFGCLAVQNDIAVGLANWVIHPSCAMPRSYCYLQILIVDARARRCGIGRALLAFVHCSALEANCARVQWMTHKENVPAIQLYQASARKTDFVNFRIDFD
jgi:ribosomal protein S18 acetylase RimI-like enzyme